MVTRLDRDVGRILDLVRELGLDDQTIVVFTSDNGPTYDRLGGSDSEFFRSAGPFRGRKGSLYEGGVRVPAIVRWKGQVARRHSSASASPASRTGCRRCWSWRGEGRDPARSTA